VRPAIGWLASPSGEPGFVELRPGFPDVLSWALAIPLDLTITGAWKVLGVMAILTPRIPRLNGMGLRRHLLQRDWRTVQDETANTYAIVIAA
jgi:hypothetical protein